MDKEEREPSQLSGLLPSGAQMLSSSEPLPWKGFFVEKNAMIPGERMLDRPRHAPAAGVMHPRLLRRLRDWMESNLHRDISLMAMAQEANYSSTHLLRSFRASTGMTPHQYLLELRVAKAEGLLRGRGHRLIDVAAQWVCKPGPLHPNLQDSAGGYTRSVSSGVCLIALRRMPRN